MKITLTNIDITKIPADAIINAANSSLLGGGGVDGAIHRAGGKEILDDCIKIRNKQGGCDTGQAVITTAGKLPAKYVIHTVGPVWNGGSKKEKELLSQCYGNSLNIAKKYNCEVLAFIKKQTDFKEIIFACYDKENYLIYQKLLKQ